MDVGGKGWGWGGGGGGISGGSLGKSNGMRHTGHKQVIVYKMLMPIFVIGTKGLSYVNINFFASRGQNCLHLLRKENTRHLKSIL